MTQISQRTQHEFRRLWSKTSNLSELLTVSSSSSVAKNDLSDIIELIDELTAPDGTRPISEHVELHLRQGGDEHAKHLLVRNQQGKLLGYAHLDCSDSVKGPSAELVISQQGEPDVLACLLAGMSIDAPESSLRLWARGESKHLIDLANEQGFGVERKLVKMGRSLYSLAHTDGLPSGFNYRTFVPGEDEDLFLEANREIFQALPDQKRWTREDLAARMAEDWFDPAGFFLVFEDGAPGRLAGFHWTKIHGQPKRISTDTLHSPDHGHDAFGEVYVLGVSPKYQKKGLGKALTSLGLEHLAREGLDSVILYVDANNTGAVGLYGSLGFSQVSTDFLFRKGA